MAAAKVPPSLDPGKGLRVLTLDGSGLITVASSEVFFLEGIAHRWAFDDPEKGKARDGTDVRISEMFDIVGGTGIGGFYAILFTALNMTIGQVIKCQNILHEKIFTSKPWAEKDPMVAQKPWTKLWMIYTHNYASHSTSTPVFVLMHSLNASFQSSMTARFIHELSVVIASVQFPALNVQSAKLFMLHWLIQNTCLPHSSTTSISLTRPPAVPTRLLS
ncbi:hypothetical protein DL96DRAFT_716506 [Flagelloscypha sp. PMI_526]|nr:hypothetical protein DL96DRAFT_716506 [Flagelloscypha sp. PMI_526]